MIPSLLCSPLARRQQVPARVDAAFGIGRPATRAKATTEPLLSSLSRGRASASTTSTTKTTAALPLSSSPPSPSSSSLSVVITGGSKGLGKAIAREHLHFGDSVVVAARDESKLLEAARERAEETGAELVLPCSTTSPSSPSSPSCPPLHRPKITPIATDVSDLSSVELLVSTSLGVFGGKTLDAFYCNAGESGGLKSFASSSPSDLSRVVNTNLLGAVLCSRVAMEAMRSAHEERLEEEEEKKSKNKRNKTRFAGHLFRLEGAGSDLLATPGHACYGATKAATAQLVKSLAAEEEERVEKGSGATENVIGVHALSPGRVLTPLLLTGLFPPSNGEALPLRSKFRALAFDALCEHPEVVAEFLVPRAREVVLSSAGEGRTKASSRQIRYLTPPRALFKLLSGLLFTRGRHFSPTDATPTWETDDGERIKRSKEEKESRRSKGEKRRRELAATAALFLFASLAIATVA